jgi:hypothetical protein
MPQVRLSGRRGDADRCLPRLNAIRITAEAERNWQHRMQEPRANFETRAVARA